jgi:hypothetical protein
VAVIAIGESEPMPAYVLNSLKMWFCCRSVALRTLLSAPLLSRHGLSSA